MAVSVTLERIGFRAVRKTPKLIVSAEAPTGVCLLDNCGQVIGRQLKFNWEIKGRQACTGIIKTIQRFSASVINYTGNQDVSQFSADAFSALPGLQNPSRSKTYFGGLPQNGIETRTVTSPRSLRDECNNTHGGSTDEIYERYIYTDDCVYKPAFQYSVTHAADDSITPAFAAANFDALGGTYLSTIADSVDCNAIEGAILAIWGGLTTNPISLSLGAYE